jgi:hypothetical protein
MLLYLNIIITNLSNFGVAGEQPPVYVSSVADIRVVILCCCGLQHFLHQAL